MAEYPNMCAGQGKYFSLTKPKKYPELKAYHTLNWHQIIWYAENPMCVPKDDAWWVLPSTLINRGARLKYEQMERGEFWLLGADIDKGNLDLATVVAGVQAIIDPGTEFLVYATKNSTPDDKRWRSLVPSGGPIPAAKFHHAAGAFNEALGLTLGVQMDPVTERLQQYFYVANLGVHYQWQHVPGAPWGATPTLTLALQMADLANKRAANDPQRRQNVERQKARGANLEKFNQTFPVDAVLEHYGFSRQSGGSDNWRYEGQSTKSYGTTIKPDGTWVTASGTVREMFGRSGGDSFDIFVAMEGGGDFRRCYAALVSALHSGGRKMGNIQAEQPGIKGFYCGGKYIEIAP